MELTAQELDTLKASLKAIIVKECNIKNAQAAEIRNDDQLIGGRRLALDSLDAVELMSAVERRFNIHVQEPGAARKILRSVNSLTEFIVEQKNPEEIRAYIARSQMNH